ncbi:unnamed protein product [Closterium sp. NIES-65]|nr:unnamed protein product [Closterium sp. NIES-65]
MLSQGQLAQSGMDVSQTEWEVFMCYRALRELSGQFYHRLPTTVKNELRDAGLCHYMAIIRSPEGQLIQFDFGPRGKDVEWRPASNSSSNSNSSSSSLQIAGNSNVGGLRRDQMLQCTMSCSKPTTTTISTSSTTTTAADATATPTNCSRKDGCNSNSTLDRSDGRSSCGCVDTGSFRQQAQRMGLQGLACNALLQHGGGHGSGMASLTLHQMDLADCAIPPPNGEIREELISALPETAVRVGVTRMSIADMRAFYSSLDFNYLLNRNDCRHFVDAFVHYTTGVDRASARLIRANMNLRMRARPWQPVDPVIIICQRILEKENTYRVFTACHAAFTSLSSAVLLRVGIQSGRLHQRLARVVQSSAMVALRRALPHASAIGGGAIFRAAGGPLGMLSAAMAAGAVAAAAAVAATGMRVRGMATRQLRQLVGLPHRHHWQIPKPALALAPAPAPAPLPQAAVSLAAVAAGPVGVGPVQQQLATVAPASAAVAGAGAVAGGGASGTGLGVVTMRIEVPVVGPCSVPTGIALSPVSPRSPKSQKVPPQQLPQQQEQQEAQQEVQPCSVQPQQQAQPQQSQQQQVNAASWPSGSRRSRKAKAATELKAENKTRKAAPAGSKKTIKSETKALRSAVTSSSNSSGVSKGGNGKGGSKASEAKCGLPGLLAHFSPLSSLLVWRPCLEEELYEGLRLIRLAIPQPSFQKHSTPLSLL